MDPSNHLGARNGIALNPNLVSRRRDKAHSILQVMGRSRLIYRSKHRGTLSENSRREIREAHAKRNQEKKDSAINESEIIEEVDKQSEEDSTDDEVQEVPSCDILTFPKLYIRECEFTDYAKHIDMKDRQQSILFPVFSEYSDDA